MDVPERFFADFVSEFPSEATLRDVTNRGLVFGRASLANLVKYTAWEQARRIEAIAIPEALSEPASALFEGFGSYMAGIQALETPRVPDVLLQTASSFSAVASAMGAFESVPIVGMILDFVLFAVEGGIAAYGFQNTEQLEAEPMGYSKVRDTEWTQASLRLHQGDDLTPLFLPVNDASGGVRNFNVQVEAGWTGYQTEVTRSIFVPDGPPTFWIGGLPNTPHVPKGYEFNLEWNPRTRPGGTLWSAFMPSTSQAILASWQSVLANTRAAYLVDAVAVERAWATWQDNMRLWGWGSRYSGDTKVRIALMSMPRLDYAQAQRIANDGFRRLVPFKPGFMSYGPDSPKNKPYYGPLLGDVGAWAARVQLGRRQRKYLGTLTCAYCSERDPAFKSDPELADLLSERRAMLLQHPDVVDVDLAQVVDRDYRQAVALRQGPKPIADAPRPGGRPTGIASAPTFAPVAVEPLGSGAPFLQMKGRARGNAMANAAALALLSFLVR